MPTSQPAQLPDSLTNASLAYQQRPSPPPISTPNHPAGSATFCYTNNLPGDFFQEQSRSIESARLGNWAMYFAELMNQANSEIR